MDKNILISTIITTYKRSDSLDRAVHSVLEQNYPNIEVIVVDDNDSDTKFREDASKVMKKYKNDNRVTYIKHEVNMNGAHARNSGIKIANGALVTFLDDDDYFEPTRFSKLIPKLWSTPENVGAIFSGYRFIKDGESVEENTVQITDRVLTELLKAGFSIGSGSNFILKREALDNVGLFDGNFLRHQDFEYLLRVAEKYDFVSDNECLLNIQVDSEQQNKIDVDKLIATKKQYLEKFSYLITEENKNEVIGNHVRNTIYHIFVNNQIRDYLPIFKLYFKYQPGLINFLKLFKSYLGVKVNKFVR